jgi:hypothetical protein
MRFVILIALMTFTMFVLITWATRPDILQAQYERITAPITQHFADKRMTAWQEAKEQARQKWMSQAHLPEDCAHPATALHALECKNQLQMLGAAFENDWARKIASGWHPDGVN